jgi:sterol desaturase/sphingolipid hydroxylase (fatty acid hydroxylase superfamily)
VAVYLLVAGALAVGSRSVWPVVAIAGLTANKFSAAILAPKESGTSPRHVAQWAMQTALFLFFGMASGFLPVPALGVTETYGEGSGQWGEEPYWALAAGAGYFAALGFAELYGGVGKERQTPDPSDAVVHAD